MAEDGKVNWKNIINIRFKGEHLNGKRNGKGIEYWDECISIFLGEFKMIKNGMV